MRSAESVQRAFAPVLQSGVDAAAAPDAGSGVVLGAGYAREQGADDDDGVDPAAGSGAVAVLVGTEVCAGV